jgi:hypothetical protein
MTNAQTAPAKILAPCDRCEGRGRINGFDHYAKGICFACEGKGERLVANYVQVMTPAMIAAAAKAEAEQKVVRAFVDAHLHLSVAQLVTKLGAVSFEKVYLLHSYAAGFVHEGNDDARPMLAACKVLLERFIIEDLRAA